MTLLIVLIVVIVLAVLLIGIYNRLVALRQNTNQAFADIDVQLRQRHDLVPNLVETVKGYAAHERGTLEEVVQARNNAVNAEKSGDPKAMGAAEGALSASLGKLFALAEAYPDLKANANFIKLQDELTDLENKIAAARRYFNNAAAEYNTAREQFPASMFAATFGFAAREFFNLGDERASISEAPQVKFS